MRSLLVLFSLKDELMRKIFVQMMFNLDVHQISLNFLQPFLEFHFQQSSLFSFLSRKFDEAIQKDYFLEQNHLNILNLVFIYFNYFTQDKFKDNKKQFQVLNFKSQIYGQFTQIGFLIILYIFVKYYTKFVYTNCFGFKFIYYIRLMNNTIIQIQGLNFIISIKVFVKQMVYLIKKVYYNQSMLIVGIQYLKFYDIQLLILCLEQEKQFLLFFLFDAQYPQQFLQVKIAKDDIILIKKFLFLTVLIIMQSCPLIQCILLTCILFLDLGQIMNIEFNTNKLDLFIIIWMEAPVMVLMIKIIIFLRIHYFV
ncbi:unnamed protein product [Paramecium pentaurelia]|uniref:Transmembrane protein n=1 Tax=Paramecium pentaurelia TaxID=43138 RepID=A0A8S1WWB5_9CILI|nr:unnamed protein product [Paramecium pentaurelia]